MTKQAETRAEPEARRSASQIMFNHLPEQTVDINRGVWKVSRWRDPPRERGVDLAALSAEVIAQAKPWTDRGRDSGLAARLASGTRGLEVLSLARDRGIDVEPFPKLWICPACSRVHTRGAGHCPCGAESSRNQIHFVCYCPDCGTIAEPPINRCQTHREVRISFPGTMSADRIVQSCPTCQQELRRGFAGKRCPTCSSTMMAQVHRSAAVYTPRNVSIVNPPSEAARERIERAGGATQALSWVVAGMTTRWMDQGQSGVATLRRSLAQQGLSDALIDQVVAMAIEKGEVAPDLDGQIPIGIRALAEAEARQVAVGLAEARKTHADLIATAPPGLTETYRTAYPAALGLAGLEAIDFVDRFPILTGHFGYTRGPSNDPAASVLVPFQTRDGDYAVFGEMNDTEALFVRLDPIRVADWLHARGIPIEAGEANSARLRILRAIGADTSGRALELVTELVHSYAHRFVRIGAVHTGVERTSLAEYLVPTHLGFFVYAAARGDFVMGGIQAVYEGELNELLREIVLGERRCALDPGCGQNGSACVACLHLGEPSCRLFNQHLDRTVLHGPTGYLHA
jgi:hypothetical protein